MVLVLSQALRDDCITSAPPEVDMDDACSNVNPVYYEMSFFLSLSFLPPSLKVTCES